MLRSLLTVVALVAIPSVAQAETPEAPASAPGDRWTAHPFALEIQTLGSTVGYAGVGLDVAPSKYLSFNVATGQGISGMQTAAEARFRLPLTQGFALALAVGGSMGRHCESGVIGGLFDPCNKLGDAEWARWERAYWFNTTFGVDARTASGITFRAYFGGGRILNPNDGKCWGPTGCNVSTHAGTAHLGVAIGYAF